MIGLERRVVRHAIWAFIAEERRGSDVVAMVLETYDADAETVARDVIEHLTALDGQGLITVSLRAGAARPDPPAEFGAGIARRGAQFQTVYCANCSGLPRKSRAGTSIWLP